MARGWRKEPYNRRAFGEKVWQCRSSLGWTCNHLADITNIHRATLKHVEEGGRSLPKQARGRLVEILTESLKSIGQPIDRPEFLELAGLITVTSVIDGVHSSTQSTQQSTEVPLKSSTEDSTHEARAQVLSQQQEWRQAAVAWHLAALEAEHRNDRITWARCTLEVGQMALNLSQLEVAESHFKQVLEWSEQAGGSEEVIQANLKLGWLLSEQGKFEQAVQCLKRARMLLRGHEELEPLEGRILHFLGRAYSGWYKQEQKPELKRMGLAALQKQYDYSRNYGSPSSIGYNLLRQIPFFIATGETRAAKRLLNQCEELMNNQGTEKGHIYLHKGLLKAEMDRYNARDCFEVAFESYKNPIFYPKGLSQALRETSQICAEDDKELSGGSALEFAVAAAILHPYGENIDVLRSVAFRMYWRMGASVIAFNKYRKSLEEKLWAMGSGPFLVLRQLAESSVDFETHRFERTAQRIYKMIGDWLPRS